jgi:membrane peptidoglycan carboxypeptidase
VSDSRAGRGSAGSRNGQRSGDTRSGRRAAAEYSADGYGRTAQRSRQGAAGDRGWSGREDDPRTARGRRSGQGGGAGGGYGGGSGGYGRGRRSFKQWFLSGDWWRRWTWKKALGVAAAICVGVPVLLLVAFFVAYEKTPLPSATTAAASAEPSQVYYGGGRLLGTFSDGGLNKQILPTSQIPAVMNNAIIAAEDRHFFSEGGISPTGILRAAYTDLTGGNVSQGGSTLTEQLVKNYYVGFASKNNTDKSANDKFKQILAAIKLAHSKSKPWILTQYLNTVYFGQNAYGVGAAAQTYFGKRALDLTSAQAAMLAAMVQQPSYFSTDRHAGAAYTDLVARYQYVLQGMVIDGVLSQAKFNADKAHFPAVHVHLSSSLNGYRGYLMGMVTQELTKTYHLTPTQVATGGYKIKTTFSQSMMRGLYKAVAADKIMMKTDGQGLPSYAFVGSVVEQPSNGAIKAIYGGPGYGARHCAEFHCYLNMAENPKQVGSSFKPYVLAAAVRAGMDVQDSVLNGFSPLWIPEGQTSGDELQLSSQTKPLTNDQGYLPFNEPSENQGALTVQKAAAISSDPAFEDLAHRAGVQNVIDMAGAFGVGGNPFTVGGVSDLTALNAQFGVNSKADSAGSVAIALGEGQLTAVEQASTFATLADNGIYHAPHVIASIRQGSGGAIPSQIQPGVHVLTTSQAADVDYALSADNIPGGTAYPDAAWPGRTVIGKTGTTQTAQDAWFIGAIPQYSMAVTLFTNKQDSKTGLGAQTLDILPPIGGNKTGGYGGAWPAEIWHTFMSNEFTNLAPAPFTTPDYTTGFTKWDQVDAGSMPQKVAPTPSVAPSAPTSSTSPGCQPGQACLPGSGGTTSSPPTSTSPSPNPSTSTTCTPQFGKPCPPAGGPSPGNESTSAIDQPAVDQPADEGTSAAEILKTAAIRALGSI